MLFKFCFLFFLLSGSSARYCYNCEGGNLAEDGDCTEQQSIDCEAESEAFENETVSCVTVKLPQEPDGTYSITKTCMTAEKFHATYGVDLQLGCSSFIMQNGTKNTEYCICDTDNCNQKSFNEQKMGGSTQAGVTDTEETVEINTQVITEVHLESTTEDVFSLLDGNDTWANVTQGNGAGIPLVNVYIFAFFVYITFVFC